MTEFDIHTERIGDEVHMRITGAVVTGIEYDQNGDGCTLTFATPKAIKPPRRKALPAPAQEIAAEVIG